MHGPWPRILALALLALLTASVGCRSKPVPYLHTLYVEDLHLAAWPDVWVRVRAVTADGAPAPAPPRGAVRAMVDSRRAGDEIAWTSVAGSGIRAVLIVDRTLGPAALNAQRQVMETVLAKLTDADRVAVLVAPNQSKDVPASLHAPLPPGEGRALMPPPEAARTLAALSPAAPLPAGARAGGRARAPAPTAVVARALALFDTEGDRRGRRAVILSARGAPDGRDWTALAARAAAAGADLLVLGLPPPGRRPPRGRADRPTWVFPVDPAEDLAAVAAAVSETLAGGLWGRFSGERPAVELAKGLALRANLPRGGWEEFGLQPLGVSPARLVVDRLESAGEGRCVVRFGVSDALGAPLTRRRVSIRVAGQAEDAAVEGDLAPLGLVVVVDPLIGVGRGLSALRRAAAEALRGLRPGDRVAFVVSGAPELAAPELVAASEAAALAEALRWPVPRAPRSLLTELAELAERLEPAAAEHRLAFLVLSGTAPLRAAATVGTPSRRFRAVLTAWRRIGARAAWVAAGLGGRVDRVGAALRSWGGSFFAERRPNDVPAATTRAMARLTAGVAARFSCPGGAEAAARDLSVIAVHRGRAAAGGVGTPVLPSLAGR